MPERILIVEDEQKLAELLRDYLKQEGFEVDMLHRGDEVEDWVRTHAGTVARRVFNHELPVPSLAPAAFAYDSVRRYIGPNTPRPRADGWASRAARTGSVALSAAILSVLAWIRR